MLLFFSLVTACGDGSTDDSTAAIAGTYFGEIAVRHPDPARAVFASVTFSVESGLVTGTAMTTSPTTIIGDPGELAGAIAGSSSIDHEVDLDLDFAMVGSYTLSGTLLYADVTRSLSGMLVTRDATGAVIGQSSLTAQRE